MAGRSLRNSISGSSSPPEQSRTPPTIRPLAKRIPTQYEFIIQTGDENATVAKRNLKTVRSHVMKNYLQQNRRGSIDALLPTANSERRIGRQPSRSRRSISRESLSTSSISNSSRSATVEVGSLFAGFSSSSLFPGYGPTVQSFGHQKPFALDFGYDSPQDEISLIAQAYVTSLIRDKKSGFSSSSFDTFDAKGETARIVSSALSTGGNEVPESIIFAVSLLAFGSAVDSEWDQATGHIAALETLVAWKGGVEGVDFELRRLFTWTSYCVASVLHLSTKFLPPLYAKTESFPLAYFDDAQIRAWRTVKRFPKSNNSFIFDIAVRLHQLGLAVSSDWYNGSDQRDLSNLYFDTMHRVIVLNSQEPWNGELPRSSQRQETALMFKVWAEGLPLFIWATTRHVKSRMGLSITRCEYDMAFSRVQNLLSGVGGYHAWPRGKSLEPVLATLFYCIESCDFSSPWRPWFIETIGRIVEILKIRSAEEFKKAIEFFPTTDEYSAFSESLWEEVMHGNTAVSNSNNMYDMFV
ncbi:hypothetical protein BS50DRAFT_625675 [Corynespora cassiicola Philippines]|uniref:Transcription factor domain-containing protein n=1 Tax=Corynespora cassiicola Philippines TaxID=1448308 RepID=A0A2T2N6E8_CORCC|nr:hypothetical protein BS50DRAFT_625675 [Corynespora cassiicola Philippines]